MIDKCNVPEIRFKGFDGKWDEKRLEDICVLITKGTSPINKSGNGIINFIKIENINPFSGEIRTSSRISIEEHEGYLKRSQLQDGDILFSIAGTLGRITIVKNEVLPANTNQALSIIRLNTGDIFYIITFLKGRAISEYLKKNPTVGAQPNLSLEQVSNFLISMPNDAEQRHIGIFFQNLDSLITLHQRKYDKLTTVKKAMLEKMFPKDGADVPEIRFKGFPGKWERRTLGEIVTEIQRPIELKDEHEYELVTVKRRNEGVVSRGKLKGKDILVKTYFELWSGDYIISKRQVVHGANGVVPQSLDKAIVSNEYLVAVGNERITTDFFALFSKLPHMYKNFFLSSYGIDIEKLVFDVDDWKKRYVVVPCLSEQQRISSFFQKLDSLITLQQRELDKLKNIKKACLEKMFV